MTLEERIARLETMVQKIIELPQLTNLAAKDTRNLLARVKQMAAISEDALKNPDITAEERKEHEETLAKCKYLVSPILHAEPCDNSQAEVQREQDNF